MISPASSGWALTSQFFVVPPLFSYLVYPIFHAKKICCVRGNDEHSWAWYLNHPDTTYHRGHMDPGLVCIRNEISQAYESLSRTAWQLRLEVQGVKRKLEADLSVTLQPAKLVKELRKRGLKRASNQEDPAPTWFPLLSSSPKRSLAMTCLGRWMPWRKNMGRRVASTKWLCSTLWFQSHALAMPDFNVIKAHSSGSVIILAEFRQQCVFIQWPNLKPQLYPVCFRFGCYGMVDDMFFYTRFRKLCEFWRGYLNKLFYLTWHFVVFGQTNTFLFKYIYIYNIYIYIYIYIYSFNTFIILYI